MASSFDIGRRAEQAACEYLIRQGCTVIAQNWRTPWCEIDIVAFRDNTIYFCEVKYRRSDAFGSGIDYITPWKLQRMAQAAIRWVHYRRWQGPYQLAAIEVSGADFRITRIEKDLR